MTQDSIKARIALVKDWSFGSGHIALHAMRKALEEGEKMPVTQALTFASAEEYRAARAQWRARQKTIEAQIRALKAAARSSDVYAQAGAQSERAAWSVIAYAALLERKLQKQLACAQWQAEQARAA